RLAAPLVDGLPAGWDRALRGAADRIKAASKAGTAFVLSATASNEDNFALARLAGALGCTNVFYAGRPPVPGRADGRLRVADTNPNTAGVRAILDALCGGAKELGPASLDASIRVVVLLGEHLPLAPGRLEELEVIAIGPHERGPVAKAAVALPAAAWAETAGTVTNDKGHVQRMHAAVPAPGDAIAAWEAVVRLAQAMDVRLAWTHAREVFKDMTAVVPPWKALVWAREARPLALRFAGSRG
ncbi:MAG TPA: molybdopterin-dependent oxidoreductase, partial [Kofleriaceae bacterium]|nr:molybdopterin-dependent oxidoreductase [Kofleriaceae bacterium]